MYVLAPPVAVACLAAHCVESEAHDSFGRGAGTDGGVSNEGDRRICRNYLSLLLSGDMCASEITFTRIYVEWIDGVPHSYDLVDLGNENPFENHKLNIFPELELPGLLDWNEDDGLAFTPSQWVTDNAGKSGKSREHKSL